MCESYNRATIWPQYAYVRNIHPPTTNYVESDLIAYVSDTIDEFPEANPDGLVICGGDLNRLNIERLSTSTGMKSLNDFPTRGDSVLLLLLLVLLVFLFFLLSFSFKISSSLRFVVSLSSLCCDLVFQAHIAILFNPISSKTLSGVQSTAAQSIWKVNY